MLQTMQRASRTAWRNIGAMNVAAVLGALHLKAEIVAQFVGGAAGWVVRLRVADGTVTVRSGQGEVHRIAL
jgi:chemotaxis receptor (MCP) glutamine deamidase CheD